ncbi:DUF4397 domain-containing protein [Thalassolituus sp.]|uniref:DUF4397 domain-containing protein n=1 Tax=Thalassolituus sp. TaxID=2030822 RepID=UPI003518C69D
MSYAKFATLGALTLGLMACGGEESTQISEATVTGQSYLRVLHASPDAPVVDVVLDNVVILSDVAFQDGSAYARVEEGSRTLQLREAGTSTVLYSADLNFVVNEYYSALAVNAAAELDVKVISDTATANNGVTDAKVIHAATAASAVDVFVTEPDATLGTPTLDAVAYDGVALLESIDGGEYQIRIADDASDTQVYDSGTFVVIAEQSTTEVDTEALDADTLVTTGDFAVVAVNSTKGNSPVSVVLWNDDGTTTILDDSAEIRVVHALDDMLVDVYAGGEVLLEDFAYKSVEAYQVVEPGDLQIAVAPADGATLSNLTDDVTLERGESYTVIAYGNSAATNEARLIVLNDQRAPQDDTQADIRFVHASTSATAATVDIYVYENTAILPAEATEGNLTKGRDSGYLSQAPATYTIDIVADETTEPALVSGLTAVPYAAGEVESLLIIGDGTGLEALVLDDSRAD